MSLTPKIVHGFSFSKLHVTYAANLTFIGVIILTVQHKQYKALNIIPTATVSSCLLAQLPSSTLLSNSKFLPQDSQSGSIVFNEICAVLDFYAHIQEVNRLFRKDDTALRLYAVQNP